MAALAGSGVADDLQKSGLEPRPEHLMTRTLGFVVLATWFAAGCAPNTIIRRTALINAPMAPTREGQPLERGDVRLEGHISGVNTAASGGFFRFEPGVATVGDPGVLIPDLQIGGSLWAGLPAGFEIGAQLYYAAMEWADPNVFGVLPFPRGMEEDLLMGGIGLRLNIGTGNPRLAVGLMAEVNLATIPEAIFVCRDAERCADESTSLATSDDERYRFERIDHELFFLPNVALQLGWRFGDVPQAYDEWLGENAQPIPRDPDAVSISAMPFFTLGLQSSVTNTGFEPDFTTLPDDTLETLTVGYIGIGIDAMFDKLVLGGSMLLPIEGEDAIDFGVVFNFRVGVQL